MYRRSALFSYAQPTFPLSLPFLYYLVATQLNEFATESDLFLYAVRSARMFEQSVYRAAYRQGAISAAELSGDAEPPHEGARVDPRPIGESPEVVETLEGRIREMYFEQLEEAVDR